MVFWTPIVFGTTIKGGAEAIGGVMSANKVRATNKAAQQEAANELERQIAQILSGQASPKPPRNLRDFINEKMAEDARRKGRKTAAAKPTQGRRKLK